MQNRKDINLTLSSLKKYIKSALYNITRVLTSGHVFQPTGIIFKLVHDIIGMNVLTKKNAPPLGSHFHEDWTINVASIVLTRQNAPPLVAMFFNPPASFSNYWTINGVSRVLTRFYYSHIRKNAPPLGSHVFQANVNIFKLIQNIIKTNLLTKFYVDWTINMASRE
ncbi:hypothetical protein DPMN_029215 [Dreissena polymorpha]|uniref:Uncharacterized protein n=1 Tax=Dreissena polymorpha TaxID=45954 RepID=A0A9D4RF97_DREPO|nr:hypothetical protein DPMN_029215 [Dreissena polymorpha]